MPGRCPLPPGPRPGLASLSRAPGWREALPSSAQRQGLQRRQSTLTAGQQPLPCGLTRVRPGMEVPGGWPATHIHPQPVAPIPTPSPTTGPGKVPPPEAAIPLRSSAGRPRGHPARHQDLLGSAQDCGHWAEPHPHRQVLWGQEAEGSPSPTVSSLTDTSGHPGCRCTT